MRRGWLLIPAAIACAAVVAVTAPVAAGGNVNCSGPVSGSVNGNVNATTGCTITNAQISGNVQIQNTAGPISICGTTINGNLEIHNNVGLITVDGSCGDNFVGGNVQIHNNNGSVTLSDTHVGKNLDCHGDSPPASTAGGGNTVGGNTTGNECSMTSSTHCTAGTECSASADDGNTSATATADGSGKSGTLTVTLSPSPTSDGGCGSEEGQESFSGDRVTVTAPKGYGTGNPIEVDITYEQDPGSLHVICKSNDGGKTWFPLPDCSFPEEAPPPDNVPCAQTFSGEGPSSATVYMTSTDPQFVGHA